MIAHIHMSRTHTAPRKQKRTLSLPGRLHTQVLAEDFTIRITGETRKLGCLRELKWLNNEVRALVHLRITARPQTLRIFFLSTTCL